MLSENAKNEIEREVVKYPEKRAVVLAALHLAQQEHGWISEDSMVEVASLLDLTDRSKGSNLLLHDVQHETGREAPFAGMHESLLLSVEQPRGGRLPPEQARD